MKKRMRIADMKAGIDVIEYADRKWTREKLERRPYYDKRFILFEEINRNSGSKTRGFHQDSEHEIIDRISEDGKVEV